MHTRTQGVWKYGASTQKAVNVVGPDKIVFGDGTDICIVRSCLERDDLVYQENIIRVWYRRNDSDSGVPSCCHGELHRHQRWPRFMPIPTLVTNIVEEVGDVPHNHIPSVHILPPYEI